MKIFFHFILLILYLNTANAQYGGNSPVGSTNYIGDSSYWGVFTDITYNDGSITSSPSATVYFIGSIANKQHQLLANAGSATAMQIGNAILKNGTGGLMINNPSAGLEILNNFNFNGQNSQVVTVRNSNAIAINNLHIDANATISGGNINNNINGYLKKDGDAASFIFPLADGSVYAPMETSAFGSGNSISSAYYNSDAGSAATFEGGPFTITSVNPSYITVSSTEYWNVKSIGTPSASLSLSFQGDYSTATLSSLFIMGWNNATSEWEKIPGGPATGLLPGNTISSSGNVNFSDYSAFTLGYILPPIVNAIATPGNCGRPDGFITVTGSKGIPPYQFSIDGIIFQSDTIFKGLDSGNYTITIKDSFGLTNTVTIHLPGSSPGVIFAGNDTSIAINQSIQLNAVDVNNAGFDNYAWSPTYGLSDATIQNPVCTLDKDITYTVTATAPDGCEASGQIVIKVFVGPDIYVPNAFTPNGDGRNDILKAIPIGLKELKYFSIYDRWGQRLFYTTNASNGWDGKNGTKTLLPSTYVWMAEGIDTNGKTISRKGTVILIR